MNISIQSIFWCVVAIICIIVIVKVLKQRHHVENSTAKYEKSLDVVCTDENNISPIDVVRHPNGSAREALLANIGPLTPLFEALNDGEIFNDVVNDAIVKISNEELMNLWVKICNNRSAIIRVLASWGIRREDEIQFQPQKHHFFKIQNGG